jgi:uncharacterized membrane protein YidH (DUF202 family)
VTDEPDTPRGGQRARVEPTGDYEGPPGLAAERTELAWSRSGLSLVACGAALMKGVDTITGRTTEPLIGAVVLVLGGVVWASGIPLARARARGDVTGQRRPARFGELAPVAVGTALVGVSGVVVATFFRG